MSRKRWLVGIAVMVGVCVLPASATAKGGHFVIRASRSEEFRVQGSGGYSISVLGSNHHVYLMVRRGNSSATYGAPGTVSPEQIMARFGNLGRVSVRFHPNGPARLIPLPKGNCQGQGELVQRGTFVGAIEFEGEQAYTDVDATRAKGKATKAFKQTCSREASEGGRQPALQLTNLIARSESVNAVFAAFKVVSKSAPRLDSAAFVASIAESLPGQLVVVRSISMPAGVETFTSVESGGRVTSATVAPPAPFSGTATFERKKGSRGIWTGSLTGEFLGRGTVSLVEPDFIAEIEP